MIVLEGAVSRHLVYSTESLDHAYRSALQALVQAEQGQFDQLLLFAKSANNTSVRVTRVELPLGPGSFSQLTQSTPIAFFVLSIADITRGGTTYSRVVITQQPAFVLPPAGAQL